MAVKQRTDPGGPQHGGAADGRTGFAGCGARPARRRYWTMPLNGPLTSCNNSFRWVASSMKPGLVLDALEQALSTRTGTEGLVDHSDRGVQYLSICYSERLAEAGVESAVGSIGDSDDYALAEAIIWLLKIRVIRRHGPWHTIDSVEYATLEWVDWFIDRRLLKPIGNMPLAEIEQAYYCQLE